MAGERGLVRQEKLFLTRNTLPLFDRLLDILDALPGECVRRSVGPYFFAGLARRYEDERITEKIRDTLPDRINRFRPKKRDTWLSEREWIPIMLETASQPRKLMLKLDVNETNIDDLENRSCEDIFAGRQQEYQASYRAIPSLEYLCDRYGDRENRRVYIMSRDVEGKWMAMHERATGAKMPLD
jgi:hypothetical protein